MATHAGTAEHPGAPRLTSAEFEALFARLRDTTARGPGDRRGALTDLAPAQVLAAVGEVRTGRTVSLAAPIETVASPDNPEPCSHEMVGVDGRITAPGLHFAMDSLAMNVHGNADSHIDALCHVAYDGALYNGVPPGTVTADGEPALSIDVARDGIVGRGVLLDIPRVRGVPWLDPGDHVTVADLEAAERTQHVRVGTGDLLFVRVGHRRRRTELGAWDAAQARAGLHPTTLPLLAERGIAALGSDGNNDTAPSSTAGVDFPVHVLAITAMGLHLLDYLQFEELLPHCVGGERWSFLCAIAPLRLPSATGSPVNPIAIL
ncbi:MAG: cyclase family protein [Pseudonocardia sp.]|nr:cyclase family protein [Pseudonocardia sp.]